MIELLDKNIMKILTIFSLSPGSRLNRKIIKEKTNLNNIILDKTLAKLTNFKILIREKSFFVLSFNNKDSKQIIDLISENYTKLKQLPLKDYFINLDIMLELSKIKNISDVYLFGSYAKLIFKEKSDIDIAVVSNNITKEEVNKQIIKLEKKHKKAIEIHFFTKNFYNNKKDPLVKEILQHGIQII